LTAGFTPPILETERRRMEARLFFDQLMNWFSRNRRDDPWSANADSYSVWISEIMLQQTTVPAAAPYFQAWMTRFPSLAHVASAPVEEVLRMWEGLGYYSRAVNIRKTAGILSSEGRSTLPPDYTELCRLPGIGDNTARAILSLAFGLRYPVLDANVRKIIMRFFLTEKWTPKAAEEADLFIREGMDHYPPGRVNEALMQFGQTVCLRKKPRCPACPLSGHCRAYLSGREDAIPPPAVKRVTEKKTVLLIPAWEKAVGILKRKEGIGRGMWSFPACSYETGQARLDQLREKGRTGILPLKREIHSYTRYRDELFPYLLMFQDEDGFRAMVREKALKPVSVDDLAVFPFLSAYRKIAGEVKRCLERDGV